MTLTEVEEQKHQAPAELGQCAFFSGDEQIVPKDTQTAALHVQLDPADEATKLLIFSVLNPFYRFQNGNYAKEVKLRNLGHFSFEILPPFF